MKRKNTFAFLLVSLLLCSGCFPYHFTRKPGVSGNVIDARTGKSIQGAQVRLTTYSFPKQEEKLESTTTQEDGSFIIPPEQIWSLYIVPLDPGQMKGILSIQLEGYKQFVKEFYINTMGPSITRFKGIQLENMP
jgi:hypothetical protein